MNEVDFSDDLWLFASPWCEERKLEHGGYVEKIALAWVALYAANRICLLIVFTSVAVAICVVVAWMICGAAVRSRCFFLG